MKKIISEVFIADDGTQFFDEYSCNCYENESKFDELVNDDYYWCDDSDTNAISTYNQFYHFLKTNSEFVKKVLEN